MSFNLIIALRKNESVAHGGALSKRATVGFDASQCRGIHFIGHLTRDPAAFTLRALSDGGSRDEAVRALRHTESGRREFLLPLRLALRSSAARPRSRSRPAASRREPRRLVPDDRA